MLTNIQLDVLYIRIYLMVSQAKVAKTTNKVKPNSTISGFTFGKGYSAGTLCSFSARSWTAANSFFIPRLSDLERRHVGFRGVLLEVILLAEVEEGCYEAVGELADQAVVTRDGIVIDHNLELN